MKVKEVLSTIPWWISVFVYKLNDGTKEMLKGHVDDYDDEEVKYIEPNDNCLDIIIK